VRCTDKDVGAPDRNLHVFAPGHRVNSERGRDAADALRIEDVNLADLRADSGSPLEYVGLHGRVDHRARVAEQDAREPCSLALPGRGQDQHMKLGDDP